MEQQKDICMKQALGRVWYISEEAQITHRLKFISFLSELVEQEHLLRWRVAPLGGLWRKFLGHMQTHRRSSFIFSPSFQGSTPRLLMHLPVSKG